MKHREVATLLIIQLFLLGSLHPMFKVEGESRSTTGLYIRKEVTYVATFDIFGNISSSRVDVAIVIESSKTINNLTVIDKMDGLMAETFSMVEGPEPTAIETLANGTKIIKWANLRVNEASILTLKYTARTAPIIPITVYGDIWCSNATFNPREYILENVTEKSILRLDIMLALKDKDHVVIDGEKVHFPYVTTLVFAYPKDMVEAYRFNPEPNATSTQEENKITYWNMILFDNVTLEAYVNVKNLGAWRTIWIPPITIQLNEDPETVLNYIKKNNIEEVYNGTLKSYEDLKSLRDELTSTLNELDYFASIMEKIGRKELEAAKLLEDLSKTLLAVLKLAEKGNLTAENIDRALNETRIIINSTVSLLEEIGKTLELNASLANQTQTPNRLEERIENLTQNLRVAEKVLGEIKGEDIEKILLQAKASAETASEAHMYLEEAGEMHLEIAGKMRSEYKPSVEESIKYMDKKLSELRESLDRLNSTYLKVKALEELAVKKLQEHDSSIIVYVNGFKEDVGKSIKVKYMLSLELPLLTSRLPKPVDIGHGVEEANTRNRGRLWLIATLIIMVVVISYLAVHRRKKPVVAESLEEKRSEEEILKLIEEIEEKLGE